MLFLGLLLVCGSSMAFAMTMPKVTYNLEDAEALFEKFIVDYNKSYANEEEKQMRLEIFKKSLQEINEKNLGLEKPVFGITQFVDLLREEFQNYLGKSPTKYTYVIGNVESQYAIKYKRLVELSEQQLQDCADGDFPACNPGGGFMTNGINYLIHNGAELEQDYPFVGHEQYCQYNRNLTKVRVTGCREFTGINEDQLKEVLYQYGPLAIGVCSDDLKIYNGGILLQCQRTPFNHGMLLVGYGSENGLPFWTLKNSWGPRSGENGYVRILRGQNTCGLLTGMIVTASVA